MRFGGGGAAAAGDGELLRLEEEKKFNGWNECAGERSINMLVRISNGSKLITVVKWAKSGNFPAI